MEKGVACMNSILVVDDSLFMRQMALNVLGYPKIDLVKESEIISTKEAKEIMETGEDKGVDI